MPFFLFKFYFSFFFAIKIKFVPCERQFHLFFRFPNVACYFYKFSVNVVWFWTDVLLLVLIVGHYFVFFLFYVFFKFIFNLKKKNKLNRNKIVQKDTENVKKAAAKLVGGLFACIYFVRHSMLYSWE